jgi:hypothetical protein
MRSLNEGLDYWADETAANDLAEGAQWRHVLACVQVRSPPECNTAKTCDNGMVVENFN